MIMLQSILSSLTHADFLCTRIEGTVYILSSEIT